MIILIDSNIPLLSEILSEDYKVFEFEGGELTNGFIKETRAECIFVRSTTKCNVFLLGNTDVEFVGTATAGTDNIDKDYFQKNNIKWVNAAGSNSLSVTEYVALAVQLWCIENVKNIEEMTIGVVGYGNIGKKVAKLFSKFAKQVLVTDPHENILEYENVKIAEYDNLLELSDVITFHTPLTKTGKFPTYRMLNTKNIHKVKDSTLLVNASRGGVISEYALKFIDFNLNNLVLDVWENEPTPNSELVKRCFISTPHIAGHSVEAKLRGSLNMIQAFELHTGHRVNKDTILNKLDEFSKIELEGIDFYELYKELKSNINTIKTSAEFKSEIKTKYDYDFSDLRKSYKKHRETLINDLI
jgi:erythronate-4-phosphate dehydrogenase